MYVHGYPYISIYNKIFSSEILSPIQRSRYITKGLGEKVFEKREIAFFYIRDNFLLFRMFYGFYWMSNNLLLLIDG